MKKWREKTSTIKAFTLGYRYSFVTHSQKAVLGNLIEDILEYGSTPEILSAFRTGEYHGNQDRKFLEQNLKKQEALQKDEEQRIDAEVTELRKIRAEHSKGKDQSKSR
ncbi:hypothetical protein ACQY1Q_13620 [Tenacibaculum sp. TC6]|uniref:hypothetical protein n=1 Tax=Tenacibaculum sp. TC6 TaxID=3423223 RepID=UPI003D35BB82